MRQKQAELVETSDPEGSIFLRKIEHIDEPEKVENMPSLESLKRAFLSLKDWERADGILDAIESHYPEAVRATYGHLQLALLIERSGVEKSQDDSQLLLIVEIRNYLYTLVANRRTLGAIALKSAV